MESTPVVEAAPTEVDLPFVDETPVEETVETETAPAETEAAKVDEAAPAPLELAEFRDDKGSLDAAKIKPMLAAGAEAANFRQHMIKMMDTDPDVAVAVLKSMKKNGTKLTPEQEAVIAPKAAPVPAKTEEQEEAEIATEYQKILAKDGEAAARKYYMHQRVTIPAQKAAAEHIAAERAKAEAEMDKIRQADQKTASNKQIESEFALAAKTYPDLIKANKQMMFGHEIADKPLFDMMVSLKQQALVLPIPELVELALLKLKRHPLGKTKPATAVAPRTTTNSAATKVRSKLRPGEMEMEIQR